MPFFRSSPDRRDPGARDKRRGHRTFRSRVARALVVPLAAPLAIAAAGLQAGPAAAATPVSQTQHVHLGFTTTVPINQALADSFAGVHWNFAANGSATLTVDLGADLEITYNRDDLKPGGTVPVQVKYTPTNDAGPEFDLDITADLTASVDVDAGTYVAACIPLSPLFPLCPVLVALDSIDSNLQNFQVAGITGNFTAPLGADAPVVLPGSGDSAVLQFAGLNLLSAHVDAGLTLGPVGPGLISGLGGAATVATPNGATLVGGELPGIADVLEWQAAASTQTVTLQLPVTPGASAGIDLSPIYHWLNASANVAINFDFEGIFGALGDPGNVNIFSGSLGQLFVDNGIDTQIGDAVKAAIGFDPGFAARVAAGNIPIPRTDPEIATLSPTLALGGLTFTLDLDADNDGLLDGEEIALGTNPDNPDTDGDGLTDGQEVKTYGTNPLDADSDDDGLTDGQEVNTYHTDPLDPDTDNDGLTDGQEVNTYHTDPLDPDTDNDGLSDGDEVNVYGTDPLDADTDNDGLNDGIEITYGTDPLDPDTDNDGIPDGQDSEFVQNAINGLPDADFKGNGHRAAILAQLDSIEKSVAQGHKDVAVNKLQNLREHLDGCGATADNTDWIINCTDQIQIRALIDLLITNLS